MKMVDFRQKYDYPTIAHVRDILSHLEDVYSHEDYDKHASQKGMDPDLHPIRYLVHRVYTLLTKDNGSGSCYTREMAKPFLYYLAAHIKYSELIQCVVALSTDRGARISQEHFGTRDLILSCMGFSTVAAPCIHVRGRTDIPLQVVFDPVSTFAIKNRFPFGALRLSVLSTRRGTPAMLYAHTYRGFSYFFASNVEGPYGLELTREIDEYLRTVDECNDISANTEDLYKLSKLKDIPIAYRD